MQSKSKNNYDAIHKHFFYNFYDFGKFVKEYYFGDFLTKSTFSKW